MDTRLGIYLSLIGCVLSGTITVERKIGYSPDRFTLYGNSCPSTHNCSTYGATSITQCECICNNHTSTYSLSHKRCLVEYSECTGLKFINHDEGGKIYSLLFIRGSEYQLPQQVQNRMNVDFTQCQFEVMSETQADWVQVDNVNIMLNKTSQSSTVTLINRVTDESEDNSMLDLSGLVIQIKFNCQQTQYCMATKYQGITKYEMMGSTSTPSGSAATAARVDVIIVFYVAGISMFVLIITAVIGLIVYKCVKSRHDQPHMKVERLDENGNGTAHSMSDFRLTTRFTKHKTPSRKIEGRFIKNMSPRGNQNPLTRSRDSVHPGFNQSVDNLADSPEPSRPNSARSATFVVNHDEPDQILHRLPFKTGSVNSRPSELPFDPNLPEPVTDEHRLNPDGYKAMRYIKKRLTEFEGTGLPQVPTKDIKEQFFKPQHQKLANYGGIIGEYSEQGGALKASEEISSSHLTINYDNFETEHSNSSNKTAIGAVSRHSQPSAVGSDSYQTIEWEPITEDVDGAANVSLQVDQHPDIKFNPEATPSGTIRPGFFFKAAPTISSSDYATIPVDGLPLESEKEGSPAAISPGPSVGPKPDPIYAVVKKKKKTIEKPADVSNNETSEKIVHDDFPIPPLPAKENNIYPAENQVEITDWTTPPQPHPELTPSNFPSSQELSTHDTELLREQESESLNDNLTLHLTNVDIQVDLHEGTALTRISELADKISVSSKEDDSYQPELIDSGLRPEAEGAVDPDMPSTNIDDLVFHDVDVKNEFVSSKSQLAHLPSAHLGTAL